MDLVHVWYDDGYWSRSLHSTIPIPIHDLKVKVTDFYVKVFRISLFHPSLDLVHVSYDGRYWSKILCITIHTPIHDLKVNVTDLELLC